MQWVKVLLCSPPRVMCDGSQVILLALSEDCLSRCLTLTKEDFTTRDRMVQVTLQSLSAIDLQHVVISGLFL